MPPGKGKPKDDTWTTNELNEALKRTRGDQERKRRSRDVDDDREGRRNDDRNGDESRRNHKQGGTRSYKHEDDGSKGKTRSNRDVSPEPVVELTEEDRERLRQERRERRGGKAEKKEERPHHKEVKPVDSDEDMKRRHLKDDEERRQRREAHDEGRVKGDKRQNKDKEEREHRREEKDKERRHERGDREKRREGGGGDRGLDDGGREQRREDGVRERRHERDDTDPHRERDRKERRHEKDEREQRSEKDDRERRRDRGDTEWHREREGKERRHERDERERHHARDEREEKENKDQRRHRSGKESQHREDDNDDYERRRQERREKREKHETPDEVRAKREDRHRDRDPRDRDRRQHEKDDVRSGEDRNRDREREERRHKREKERDERHKDRKGGSEDHQDLPKEQGDYPRNRNSEKDKRRSKEEEEEERQKRKEDRKRTEKEEQIVQARANDNYNEYEDDFEDYEEDFEDDKDEREMDEIMQALAEENARLMAGSKRFPQSDSVEHKDSESGDDGKEPRWGRMPEKPCPKSFINFVSAKQRVMDRSVASKARRRAEDLRNMIELDTVYYDMLDLPPVKEYELYIRSFGRSNTKQAYVQTNEDAVERDVQTEKVDDLEKWTQHPADDVPACGGEGLVVKETTWQTRANISTESSSVGHLLDQAAQVVSILLEEERGAGDPSNSRENKRSNLSISEGVTQLASLLFLSGRHVEHACFCPLQPQIFLTVYSRPEEVSGENPMDSYGLICVWSTRESAYPQKILTSVSQPTCACFSPVRASLAMAGMVDGSVCVWDLREPPHLHRTVYLRDQDFCIRFPTYNTAGISEKENHHSSVVAITAVHPAVRKDAEEGSSENSLGLSFQLASVEENAVVNLWVVTEIQSPDMAGSEMDLGLAPGGRIKLVHSSSIMLENPNKNIHAGSPRAVDVKLNPFNLNHFFVATDLGQIIHGVRFGSRVYPRVYQPEIDSICSVTCIDFSPFGEPYFLAGCEDGSVHLYHTSSEHPLTSWPTFTGGHPIVSLQWSRSRPAVFFALAANSALYVFDLVETGLSPLRTDQVSSDRVKTMAVASDPVSVGLGKSQPAHILLCLENGVVELHTVCGALREPQPLEKDFLARYLERF